MRVKTPTLLQMEVAECGATALGIILGYYDRIVPLSELRQKCGISRDGSKAKNILKAAQSYGLTAKGFKKSLEDLKTLTPPYIVFWDFNHFLVVEGFDKSCVYLNDPATGPRTVSLKKFKESYIVEDNIGIVLVMKPGAEFKKGGKTRNMFSALTSRLIRSRRAILFCLLTGLFLTFPRLTIPAFTQIFVDRILVENYQDWLRPLLLGMIIAAVVQGLLMGMQLKALRRLRIKLSVTMSGKFLRHLLHLPVGFYAQRFSGEIGSRIQLNDRVAEVLSGRLATTIIDTLMMALYALLMLSYDRLLTTITILFAVFNFVALQALSRSRIDANISQAQEYGKVSGVAIGGIQSIETVKASGLESDLFTKFAGYYTKAVNSQQILGLQTQILTVLPTLLTALATASILVIGGFRVINGTLSIGMLVAYQLLASNFLNPVNNLINFGSTLQELEADLDRLDDVLKNPLDRSNNTHGKEIEKTSQNNSNGKSPPLPLLPASPAPCSPASHAPPAPCSPASPASPAFRLQGEIELKNLTFGYSNLETPLIENFNLTIKPGQRIALVGSSGSGKSTIAKLICGLYQPWEGDILFDGISRTQIPRSILANFLAMVEQDIFLFAGTIRDNHTLWDSTIPEADIVKACQDAAIHEAIVQLPGGYNARLSEGGMNLSGGERQRLEIARALVKNPSILVLDEATSALDPETEQKVDRNLRRRGCSCIVVAHRLSTIRDCDEIIVLEGGKDVQRGTHEELKKQEGTYIRLISSK